MYTENEQTPAPGVSTENVWHALTQMLDVGKFFRTYCYRAVIDLGFSINEVDVLMSLRQHPERNTVKGISETVHISKGIISQAVESLRQKKLLSVHHDEKDRRSLLITLDSPAQPVLERMREAANTFAKKILNGIPTEQLKDVLGIVTQVYSNKEKLTSHTAALNAENLTGGAAIAAVDHD